MLLKKKKKATTKFKKPQQQNKTFVMILVVVLHDPECSLEYKKEVFCFQMAARRNISEINTALKIQAALGWCDRLFSLSADFMFGCVHSWISRRQWWG